MRRSIFYFGRLDFSKCAARVEKVKAQIELLEWLSRAVGTTAGRRVEELEPMCPPEYLARLTSQTPFGTLQNFVEAHPDTFYKTSEGRIKSFISSPEMATQRPFDDELFRRVIKAFCPLFCAAQLSHISLAAGTTEERALKAFENATDLQATYAMDGSPKMIARHEWSTAVRAFGGSVKAHGDVVAAILRIAPSLVERIPTYYVPLTEVVAGLDAAAQGIFRTYTHKKVFSVISPDDVLRTRFPGKPLREEFMYVRRVGDCAIWPPCTVSYPKYEISAEPLRDLLETICTAKHHEVSHEYLLKKLPEGPRQWLNGSSHWSLQDLCLLFPSALQMRQVQSGERHRHITLYATPEPTVPDSQEIVEIITNPSSLDVILHDFSRKVAANLMSEQEWKKRREKESAEKESAALYIMPETGIIRFLDEIIPFGSRTSLTTLQAMLEGVLEDRGSGMKEQFNYTITQKYKSLAEFMKSHPELYCTAPMAGGIEVWRNLTGTVEGQQGGALDVAELRNAIVTVLKGQQGGEGFLTTDEILLALPSEAVNALTQRRGGIEQLVREQHDVFSFEPSRVRGRLRVRVFGGVKTHITLRRHVMDLLLRNDGLAMMGYVDAYIRKYTKEGKEEELLRVLGEKYRPKTRSEMGQ